MVRPPLPVPAASREPVDVEVEWLGHATVVIEMDGTRLITDPIIGNRVGPLVRVAGPRSLDFAARVDGVLLSHLHADHAQPSSLRRVRGGAVVVAPHGMARWLRRHGVSNVVELRAGDETQIGDLRVKAVTAAHGAHRRPLGPTAEPIGFVVHGPRTVYFAGDTDIFDGMSAMSGTLDLALLPVWGWGPTLGPGHLDPARAAQAAALLAPRVAIPIHWGTFALPGPFGGRAVGDAPAREFAEFAARDAPDVEVRLLRPGERTTLA